MSVLLQISDPHFGTEQVQVMAALLALAHAQKPDIVVWSGDITQRARRSQFEAARRFADEIAAPHRLAIPGNHDIPLFNVLARLMAPYANFQRAFGEELEPCIATPQWLVIGVNTTRPWHHKDGEVSLAQIARVAARLRSASAEQIKVVVVHQPVCVTLDKDRTNLLEGHEAALLQWGRAGVDVILGGHIHLPYVIPQKVMRGAGAHAFWVAQAGTALSSRVRGGIANSVNVIRRGEAPERRWAIERWDFDAERAAFVLVSEVKAH